MPPSVFQRIYFPQKQMDSEPKKSKELMSNITRDILALVATIATLLAFAFAIWSLYAFQKQTNHTREFEKRLFNRIRIIENRIFK